MQSCRNVGIHQERADAPHQPATRARWYPQKRDVAERQYRVSALRGLNVGGFFYV